MIIQTWLNPEQISVLGNQMIKAAFSTMGKFSYELQQDEICRRVLMAVEAAKNTKYNFCKELKMDEKYYPDDGDYEDCNSTIATATAFFVWSSNSACLDIDEYAVDSFVGMTFIAFSQAMTAMALVSYAKTIASDGVFWMANHAEVVSEVLSISAPSMVRGKQ